MTRSRPGRTRVVTVAGRGSGVAGALARRPGQRRERPLRWLAAVGLVALLLASACATVPDSGAVQAGQVAAAQPQNFLQLIPVPPKPGWTPSQVVAGFLTASASFTGNHAVARQYLTPQAGRSWRPGWAVTVVGSQLAVVPVPPQAYRQTEPGDRSVQVQPTGQKLAFLTDNGQDVGGNSPYRFDLRQVNQEWRITNPPPYLILTAADFQRVYQPRNLYFLSGTGQALVPYPVFVPLQATSVSLANTLVKALLRNPGDWLAGAARTAAPAGTEALRPVAINGGIATVDVGEAAAGASQTVLRQLAAQLIWTLAGPSGGLSAIQSVQLEVNGRLAVSASWSGGQPQQTGPGWPSVPEMAGGLPAYSLASDGAVQVLTARTPVVPRHVPGQAGQGEQPLVTVAASPDGRYVAGLTPSGRVYIGATRAGGRLVPWGQGGGYTSVSWDHHDNLWVAGPEGVWLQPAAGGPAFGPAFSVLSLPADYQVRTFLVAPDEVRAAMILMPSGGGPAQLRLGAITRTGNQPVVGKTVPIGSGVPAPMDMTWYNADNLIVLSRSQSGSQLWEIPVNGGAAVPINTYPGTLSISAAGPANPLLAGLPNGQLAMAANVNGSWTTVTAVGQDPTYPG
jgi:hypothetical protein